MSRYLTIEGDSYEAARESFDWNIPKEYNIAQDCLRKHDPKSIALHQGYPDGQTERYTFDDIDRLSNQLAHGLESIGVEQGDRVAVVSEQRTETLLVHFAAWKIGSISVPLSVLFGTSALEHRLEDSGACVAIVEASVYDRVAEVASRCSNLETIVTVNGDSNELNEPNLDIRSFDDLLTSRRNEYDVTHTTRSDPAFLIYTSGTTGPAKGVLHAHEVCLSYCSAFSMYFERPDRPTRGVYWTPSDWAWMGGLGTIVLPAWHYGCPVVGQPMTKFTAERTYEILETFDVTHASLPPTALRKLLTADVHPNLFDLDLEVVVSGSEPLTPEIVSWVDDAFESVVINEGYGQTEIGNAVTNCHRWFELQPGSMGKPVPGYDVKIVDPKTGQRLPIGETGEIVVRSEDNPGIFERYWNDSEQKVSSDGWVHTGDLAWRDEEGYLWFVAREDDLILTSGYRIAPQSVERVLLEHNDIESAGVVGHPDDERGEIVAAFASLCPGATPSDALRAELRNRVRTELAQYAYPRSITFIDALPTTRTGKVDREALGNYTESDNAD